MCRTVIVWEIAGNSKGYQYFKPIKGKKFRFKNHVYSELKFRLRKHQKKAFKKLE